MLTLALTLLGCAADGPCPGSSGAHDTYNSFWSELDRRYAVFGERLPRGDWAALGAQRCEVLDDRPGDDALFDLVLGLARELDDGHTTLSSGARDEDAWVSVYPYYDALYTLEINAEREYLSGPLSWAAEDWFAWGWIGQIGYLSITSMDELSGSGDERDDVRAAEAAMDRVLSSLAGSRGMVVDIRANEGGWDAVSLAIAERFAGPETLAWSKQRRSGPGHDDLGPWEDSWVRAAGPGAYSEPVVLLTSGGTFSAAETFALAMGGRDRVTLLGEPSSGHFSDMVDGELPGGWEFTFSGERYRAPDGQVYEARGVPVDVPVALDVDALAGGRDVMLEAALERLAR